jgi:alkanesulfonate monooxygenase SsuD/methylene tetrahydromethanopterin reductase-like flavin-dependent oxidoreductase (luciferase family)
MLRFGVFDHVDRGTTALPRFYEDRLRLVEAYDRAGFFGYHVAEHHGTPLGMASSPGVYLSAVAQRTKNLRFGPLVYLLPFYNPLRLIEEICMLDQISNGRFQLGVGKGINPIETGFYNLDPAGTQGIYEETLDLLIQGLTHPTLDFTGRHHSYKNVPMELRPAQTPHPPLWFGVHSPASAERAAANGANTVSLLPPGPMRAVTDAYRRGQARRPDVDGCCGASLFVTVAATDEQAMEIADPAYRIWFRSFNHLYTQHGRGPVLGAQPTNFPEAIAAHRGIAGSPETVTNFLRDYIAESGINYLVCQFAFGTMPAPAAENSVALFAQHVMPALQAETVSA